MQEEFEVKRPGRGGRREGAGRKPKAEEEKRVQMTLTFSPEVAELLSRVPNRSRFLSELVVAHFAAQER